MPNRPPPLSTDRPERVWCCAVHETPGRPGPPGVPVAEEDEAPRAYAWNVPGLAIGAPAVIEGRVLEAARAGGVIGSSRRALAPVLHELEPEGGAGVVAGAWPAWGVVRRIAVTVTLARTGAVVWMGGDRAARSAS